MPYCPVVIFNSTKAQVLCPAARVASTLVDRLKGLLVKTDAEAIGGLLLKPSRGVHTFGMRYAIDILALDRDMKVIGLWESVGPGKIRGVSMRTRSVLELRSGHARLAGVSIGDQLAVQTAPAPVAA